MMNILCRLRVVHRVHVSMDMCVRIHIYRDLRAKATEHGIDPNA